VGVLCDWQIKALCSGGAITPFDPTLVNPASLDVRLGTHVYVESEELGLTAASIEGHTEDNPYYLYPNEFILGETLETFNIPDYLCAQYALKSSLARAGFEHLLAGWIDPGFSDSVLTLELKNARKYQPIPLWPGMRIGQIIFMEMDEAPQVSYKQSGRYNGDRKVAMCKGLM
jgi:dCTP deaminase